MVGVTYPTNLNFNSSGRSFNCVLCSACNFQKNIFNYFFGAIKVSFFSDLSLCWSFKSLLVLLSLLILSMLLFSSWSSSLLCKALIWLLLLLVLLFLYFLIFSVFNVCLVFSLNALVCYYFLLLCYVFMISLLLLLPYHLYQFLNLFFSLFVLFCFLFLLLIKQLLIKQHETVKVSILLCLFVSFFCFLSWDCRVIIHKIIAFLQL